jgi:hypothetical protein
MVLNPYRNDWPMGFVLFAIHIIRWVPSCDNRAFGGELPRAYPDSSGDALQSGLNSPSLW